MVENAVLCSDCLEPRQTKPVIDKMTSHRGHLCIECFLARNLRVRLAIAAWIADYQYYLKRVTAVGKAGRPPMKVPCRKK